MFASHRKQMQSVFQFFLDAGVHVEYAYDIAHDEFRDLKNFNLDIVFFQQPWDADYNSSIARVATSALTCYSPYCFHMMCSEYDYLERFHRLLWKYFVESEQHVMSYKDRFNAGNCAATGSTHFDEYLIKSKPIANLWKDDSGKKKRIVYAPHFTFNASHMVATFHKNGQAILNLASMYPDTTWAIRPHPNFEAHVIGNGIMTRDELECYYEEWEKYGIIFKTEDYFDLFKTSDCLITDCISFLADYLPTGNPVFHLRSEAQAVDFSDFGKDIINTYYQIHTNAELDRLFSRVMVDGDDFMKEKRIAQIKKLGIENGQCASRQIFDHILAELDLQ
jgi:hypothetical protein